ncbi:ABC transporter permease [Actinomycetaceae bacterium TAE3-ERU4]|nr:ABC transporter permease [Actinomycetaceae bacterium TAE3-ERU4]
MGVQAASKNDYWVPGKSPSLIEVIRHRYLLNLLVHKELRVRYRGSILGMLWSYAKPAVQFMVFYVALGVFMAQNKAIQNYVVYLFSGVVVINYFSEVFANTTRSVVGNSALVKKIYLPRQLFPVSSVAVAFVHFVPQLLILILGALYYGWRPGIYEIGLGIFAFLLITALALGLGLLFSAVNVMFRDAENFVDLILMIVTWASPVLYRWQDVFRIAEGTFWWKIYMANPITPIVMMFHRVFWGPTAGVNSEFPVSIVKWSIFAAVLCLFILVLGDWFFRRLDGRFAQEL